MVCASEQAHIYDPHEEERMNKPPSAIMTFGTEL